MLPMQSSMLSSVAPASKPTHPAISQTDGREPSSREESFEDILAEGNTTTPEVDENSVQSSETDVSSETDMQEEESVEPGEQEWDDTDDTRVMLQTVLPHVRNTDASGEVEKVTGVLNQPSQRPDSISPTITDTSKYQKPADLDVPEKLHEIRVQHDVSGRSETGASTSVQASLLPSDLRMRPDPAEKSEASAPGLLSHGFMTMSSGGETPETTLQAGDILATAAMRQNADNAVLPQVSVAKRAQETLQITVNAGLSDPETGEIPTRSAVEIRVQDAAVPVQIKTVLHPLQSVLYAQMPEQFRMNTKVLSINSVEDISLGRDVPAPGEAFSEHRPTGIQSFTPGQRVDSQVAVPRQLVDAVRLSSPADKIIEVTLTPSELGRVRMVMTPAEAGITINVTAERPETLDLLRRNINDLHQSFAEMGYEDISFAFGQDQADAEEKSDHKTTHEKQASHLMSAVPSSEPEVVQTLSYKSTGIDIRV